MSEGRSEIAPLPREDVEDVLKQTHIDYEYRCFERSEDDGARPLLGYGRLTQRVHRGPCTLPEHVEFIVIRVESGLVDPDQSGSRDGPDV